MKQIAHRFRAREKEVPDGPYLDCWVSSEASRTGARDVADHPKLHALVSLELWFQTFLDRTWHFGSLRAVRATETV